MKTRAKAPPTFTQHQIREIAVDCRCDPRTIARALDDPEHARPLVVMAVHAAVRKRFGVDLSTTSATV